ncbi:MAG: glycosyltransferase [Candidatus Kapaibacteriales bacterium]
MAKILYVWKSPFPWDIRVEKFCTALADFGNFVVLLARWGGEPLQYEEYGRFFIHRVGFNTNPQFFNPFPGNPYWKNEIRFAILKYQPDLILVREFFLVTVTRKAIGKKDIPLIFDMAEHYPEAMRLWKKYNSNPLRRFMMHKVRLPDFFEGKAVLSSDAIITVCLEQKHRLVHRYSFDPNKIEIVHNTPKMEWFSNVPKTVNIPPRTLGYHGYLTHDKPIQKFIKYFSEIAYAYPYLKLLIVGEGDYLDELKSIAINSTYPKNIMLKGKYSFNELPQILAEIDIGILPYQRNGFVDYTLTNKLFDYFAVGRPVLVSNAPPMVRVINETKAGVVLDINNEKDTKQIVSNLDKFDWREMSNNAYKWALTKYNWSVDSQQLWNFLQKYL